MRIFRFINRLNESETVKAILRAFNACVCIYIFFVNINLLRDREPNNTYNSKWLHLQYYKMRCDTNVFSFRWLWVFERETQRRRRRRSRKNIAGQLSICLSLFGFHVQASQTKVKTNNSTQFANKQENTVDYECIRIYIAYKFGLALLNTLTSIRPTMSFISYNIHSFIHSYFTLQKPMVFPFYKIIFSSIWYKQEALNLKLLHFIQCSICTQNRNEIVTARYVWVCFCVCHFI